MSFSAAFTVEQSLGLPSQIVFADTSSGSDSSLTIRRIYIRLSDGSYLVPSGTSTDYIEWAIANSTITLDIIPRSISAFVTVQWLDGTTVLYTATETYGFDIHDTLFMYGLLQDVAARNETLTDQSYFSNLITFQVNLEAAENAITLAGDLSASQNCYNRNYNMIVNQAKYF